MKNILNAISRLADHMGLIAMIFVGFSYFISDSSTDLITIMSMNFTVASLVIATLSISDSLKESGKVYLKWSARSLIASTIFLFYVAADLSNLTQSGWPFEQIAGIWPTLSSLSFSFGLYLLILGTFNLRKDSDQGLIETYAKNYALSEEKGIKEKGDS